MIENFIIAIAEMIAKPKIEKLLKSIKDRAKRQIFAYVKQAERRDQLKKIGQIGATKGIS